MPPTTLKLPPGLKERIRAVVGGTDQSAHAFMLDAIERETSLAEQRKAFVADALAAREDFARTGLGYDAREVHAYFRARGGQAAGTSEGKALARLVYARRALADLDRVNEHVEDQGFDAAQAVNDRIAEAVELLERHPLIGRPAGHGLRELVISRGKTGYIALYDYDKDDDLVVILAIRAQREGGYKES